MSGDLLKHLQEAGIRPDHPIVSYLTHIGLISDSAFVEFKPDTVELAGWCDKFKSEVTFGDNKIGPFEGDQLDVMKASLIATHKSITRKLGASAPVAVPSVITVKDSEDKAPKSLPPGIYAELVETYNKVTLNGQRRTFPEKLLLGAEKIIARMWHEHVKTKCYTGVKLGELLQHRHFTATGSVNNRVTDKTNETVLTIDADTKTLIEKNKQEWDPHTLLMILDGLEAIKWAWILIRLGDEVGINNYIQRFETLTRRHNDRLQQIKAAWNTFSWQIAMQMRRGVTFKQASQDVIQDTVQLTDILTQPSPKKPRRDSSPYKGGKGKGKGKQLWRPSRFNRRYQNQPYNSTPYQYQQQQHIPPSPQGQQWQQQTQWNPPPPPVQWNQQATPANPQWTQPPKPQDQHNPREARRVSPNNNGNRDSSEWGPQRPHHPRCHASNRKPILHLSFFDGIGAASLALKYLGANIVFTLSWETNPQCQALLQHHFQSIQHGDVSLLTRPQLNDLIHHAVRGTDDLIILITSGPPCVDFSRLRNLPPGMQGEQGKSHWHGIWVFQMYLGVSNWLDHWPKSHPPTH